MGKMSRQQKKEEEKRIIAEMEAALRENEKNVAENPEDRGQVCDEIQKSGVSLSRKNSIFDSTTPETVHCKRCKTLMENGVCPTCGFRIYVPMEKGKRDKIRLWVTVVCMAVFLVLFVLSQIRNG